MFTEIFFVLAFLLGITFHAAGVYFGIQAVLISRTPQAAIGWGLALAFLPYLAIPLFLVFGESRFSGYMLAGVDGQPELDAVLKQAQRVFALFRASFLDKYSDAEQLAFGLRGLPPTKGNPAVFSSTARRPFARFLRPSTMPETTSSCSSSSSATTAWGVHLRRSFLPLPVAECASNMME